MSDITHRRTLMSRLLLLAMLCALLPLATPSQPTKAAPSDVQTPHVAITLDGQRDLGYGTAIASDPSGDLAPSGPGSWDGTAWSDLTAVYAHFDATTLYVYADLPDYSATATQPSDGQLGLAIDTGSASGGAADPWGNAISFNQAFLPDYVIRGSLPSNDGNGWTELRHWDGSQWTGSGTNWGGIPGEQSGSSIVGTTIAYANNQGVEFAIPLADLGIAPGATVRLSLFTTQNGASKGAFDTVPTDDQSTGWDDATTLLEQTPFILPLLLDGIRDSGYGTAIASDPSGDLAPSGPGSWDGTAWSDLTAVYAHFDATTLYVYADLPDYSATATQPSDGQLGLAIDTGSASGGAADPWGNAIGFNQAFLPDYVIRGSLPSNGGNGWTELRHWDGSQWTGSGTNWGGIPGAQGGSSIVGTTIAYANNQGVEFAIPLADLGIAPGATVRLSLFTTQNGASKGAFDTVPTDDQSTGWDDATTLLEQVAFSLGGTVVTPPNEVGDGLIKRSALEHQSQAEIYRAPLGAIPTGQPATLRFRTGRNDVERVRVRLYFTATSGQQITTLTKVGSDPVGGYDYWEYTLPSQSQIGVVYYRFIVDDGATTIFYEDDSRLDGGLGEAVNASSDRSWNIYIYKSDFTTPEWSQNAVIYQIFVERFRNGDTTNDPTDNPNTDAGWFYPTERGHRFPVTPWNTIVPDPEPYSDTEDPWWLTYSSTMYGGDLEGVTAKLDYLQQLGVTTIYLNPIFDSPSNHKYDGRTYRDVDEAFGGKAAFDDLVAELDQRGMYLVLDAVPNHVSSDSPYFDRFARHSDVGACESTSSPYRSWFFFQDVPQGTGMCADSQNRPNSATYTGWFGVETLPQINTANPEVLSFWFSDVGTPNPNVPYTNTVNYWLDEGADGWRVDVVPDVVGVNATFFEDWRRNIKAEHPDAVSYSETWSEGDVRDRVLGDEFDSTMNYRFRKAVLGFGRDTRWTDNDGGQEVDPLAPSEFVAAFKAMEEDYPEPAFLSAMNLLDSHDTNRIVHVLNEQGFTGTGDNRQPVDGFAEARERQKLVTALQMTLPGAPTIYYGDEVALTGYGSDVNRDDPYNRQPYPWSDEAGYGTLPEWRKAQADTLTHYQTLTGVRNDYSFLRTGSFDPLLADDAAGVLAFGRKDETGAALVVLNQSTLTRTVTVDLNHYIPTGTVLDRVAPSIGTLSPSGTSYTVEIGPRGYGIWVTPSGTEMTPPAAPLNLVATSTSSQVSLSWQAVMDADSYNVYRSYVSGNGYEFVANTTALSYNDTSVQPAIDYYYVVKAVRDGIESVESNEAHALPAYAIDWASLISPASITHEISTITPTGDIEGQVFIANITDADGATPSIWAQVGYGPDGSNPAMNTAWTWEDATYDGDVGNNDSFVGQLLPDSVGTFDYAYRFSTNNGATWTYADLDSTTDGYDPADAGQLTVTPSGDTTAPDAPLNLREVSRAAARIEIAWNASSASDVDHYEVWRDNVLFSTTPTSVTTYVDEEVTTGITYTYKVRAVDLAFNRSGYSNEVAIRAEQRTVEVTFRVRVPAETPASDTVYIAGDNSQAFGATWNPGFQPMTEVSPNVWEYTVDVMEGTTLQYKYTRGAWERVEWWGEVVSTANRTTTIAFGNTGTQLVDNTGVDWSNPSDRTQGVQFWRDPLIETVSPTAGAAGLPVTTTVTATWSTPVSATLQLTATLVVKNSQGATVAGSVNLNGDTVVWTPADPLATGVYTATAFNVRRADISDASAMHTPYVWSFSVGTAPRNVAVTFRVRVPTETPADDIVYIAGDNLAVFGAVWDADSQPMTEVSPNVWEYTVNVLEGTTLQYKYTRGSWANSEWWGEIVGTESRSTTVNYGVAGTQLVDNTGVDWSNPSDRTQSVQFWRDPLIETVSPAPGAVGLPGTTAITATWSTPVSAILELDETLVVKDSQGATVAGSVTLNGDTVVWTPAAPLATGVYTATAFNVRRADIAPANATAMETPYVWSFSVSNDPPRWELWMPFVRK